MHRQQPIAHGSGIAGNDSQLRYILPNFRQVELLEKQIAVDNVTELNLQKEVHGFEAAIIRSALAKTGGRQRRAARLLGVKVTTLNTKIKRHKINCDEINAYPVDDKSRSESSDETMTDEG
jgi:DNA-binding NtrC family response regulator